MQEKQASPRWAGEMEKRWLEGGERRGSRSEGEPLRQPSSGDGSRTAQSVSLTTLPKTGWLTHKHTLLTLNTKRQRSDTHTHVLFERTLNFVEHTVLKHSSRVLSEYLYFSSQYWQRVGSKAPRVFFIKSSLSPPGGRLQ